ncbi:5734_t:CDS:2, partial [Dentiscutata erythropus]
FIEVSTKQKRVLISGITKYEICQKLSKPNPPKQKDLELNIIYLLKQFQIYGKRYPLIEKVMKKWLQYAFAQQLTLTDEIFIEKTKRFASNIADSVLIQQICNEDNNENVQSNTDDNYSSEPPKVFSLQETNFAKNLVSFLLQQDDGFGVSVQDLK